MSEGDTSGMTALVQPPAQLRTDDDLPWVGLGDGIELKVLQVDLDEGIWIIRNRFAPGTVVQTHRHTGPVYAFTEQGSWFYASTPTR